MTNDTFDILFLIARPAAGKSEIIDYLKRAPETDRRQRFHIGAFDEIDDFPMLWTWFEESLRKNRGRFNPERPDSILEHALPDEKMERLYRDSDWERFTASAPEFVTINEVHVPYVVFENEDDVTTARGPALGKRLEETLARLWALRSSL